jgi:hypothetical protein
MRIVDNGPAKRRRALISFPKQRLAGGKSTDPTRRVTSAPIGSAIEHARPTPGTSWGGSIIWATVSPLSWDGC